MHAQSLLHDLLHTVYGVVVHRLALVRGLIHSQEIQHVFIVTLVNEELVLVFLDDYVPGVEGLGGSHNRGDGDLGRENVGFVLLSEAADHWVLEGGRVVKYGATELLENNWLVCSALFNILVILENIAALDSRF